MELSNIILYVGSWDPFMDKFTPLRPITFQLDCSFFICTHLYQVLVYYMQVSSFCFLETEELYIQFLWVFNVFTKAYYIIILWYYQINITNNYVFSWYIYIYFSNFCYSATAYIIYSNFAYDYVTLIWSLKMKIIQA